MQSQWSSNGISRGYASSYTARVPHATALFLTPDPVSVFRRPTDASGVVRAIRRHRVRPEGGDRPHGADVLLAQPAAVQFGGGPEHDARWQGTGEHHETNSAAQSARDADESLVPERGGDRGAAGRVAVGRSGVVLVDDAPPRHRRLAAGWRQTGRLSPGSRRKRQTTRRGGNEKKKR